MSSSLDFIEYVCDTISDKYAVRYKKMFGDYMIYVNEKPVLLVCDNCVYVKMRDELRPLFAESQVGIPYAGAKEHFVLDADDVRLLNEAVDILERITPLPKKKSRK